MRPVVVKDISVAHFFHKGFGKELDQVLSDANRPAAGSASSVRCRKGLVHVVVKHIESHVSRTRKAHYRVHVCPVVVKKASSLVNQVGYLFYPSLEESESAWICKHQPGNLVA